MLERQRSRRGRISNSRRRIILIAGLVILASLGIFTAYRGQRGSAQNQRVAKVWPSFTMQYTERETNPVSGKVVLDQTVRLTFVDDSTWRTDVLADAANPKQIGSFRAVKDGVYYTYSAAGNNLTQTRVEPNTIVAITPDLAPGLYSRIRDGVDKGWTTATAALQPPAARVVSVPTVSQIKQETVPCGSPTPGSVTPTNCDSQRRVDFAANTVNTGPSAGVQVPVGGIPVYTEYGVNNVVVRQFSAQSLDLTSVVNVAVPTTPSGVQTPVVSGSAIPVVTITATPGTVAQSTSTR